MPPIKVTVKWGKETYSNIEVNTSDPPSLLKAQLFALSGVEPDRQKLVLKGSILQDESWGKAPPKSGATFMLMGSAAPVAAAPDLSPSQPAPEDANQSLKMDNEPTEEELEYMATKKYGSGIENIFNTCYMNSIIQCLFAMEPFREGVVNLQTAIDIERDSNFGSSRLGDRYTAVYLEKNLVAATGRLFTQLTAGPTVIPRAFLTSLQQRHPQYATRTPGAMGAPIQHDAEEFLNKIFAAVRISTGCTSDSGVGGVDPVVDPLFRVATRLSLRCESTGESTSEEGSSYVLKCNINEKTANLIDGLKLALLEERVKAPLSVDHPASASSVSPLETVSFSSGDLSTSVSSSTTALSAAPRVFKGQTWLLGDRLPPILTIQMMRFYFSKPLSKLAKILKQIVFPLELDVYDMVAEDTRRTLTIGREELARQRQAKEEEVHKRRRQNSSYGRGREGGKSGEEGEEKESGKGNAKENVEKNPIVEEEGRDNKGTESKPTTAPVPKVKVPTGFYELVSVVTHKGRLMDDGHYVSWVKQDGQGNNGGPEGEAQGSTGERSDERSGKKSDSGGGSNSTGNNGGMTNNSASAGSVWVRFNDDVLSLHKEEEILELKGGGDWHMAYLLFYRAVTVEVPLSLVA